MSGFSGTCQICGEYDVMADVMGRTHRCKPAWRAIPADSGYEEEDATTVYTSDAEDAAEAFMEKWDDGDISYGSDMDVIVWHGLIRSLQSVIIGPFFRQFGCVPCFDS